MYQTYVLYTSLVCRFRLHYYRLPQFGVLIDTESLKPVCITVSGKLLTSLCHESKSLRKFPPRATQAGGVQSSGCGANQIVLNPREEKTNFVSIPGLGCHTKCLCKAFS